MKKIFSTLLMGAFFIASVGMFTSCKDYDDDINANANDIAALKTQLGTLETALKKAQDDIKAAAGSYATKADITALQDQIKNLVTADALQKAIDQCKALIAGKADKTELDKLKTQVDAIDSRLNTLGTTLNTLDGAVKAAQANLAAQGYAFEKLGEALAGKADKAEVKKQVEDLQKQIDRLTVDVAKNSNSIAELKEKMQKLSDRIDEQAAQLNLLTVLVNRRLSMLVLQPAFYWEGLEGIELPAIYNTPVYDFKGQAKFSYKVMGASGLEDIKVTVDNRQPVATPKTITIMDGGVANYHVDPTSASFEDATFAFYTNEAEVNTRAGVATIATPKVAKFDNNVNVVKDGILKVPFKADFKRLNDYYAAWVANTSSDPNPANNDWGDPEDNVSYGNNLPFIALQAKFPAKGKLDAYTITSDYGVLTPAKIKLRALADNDPDEVLDQHTFINSAPHAGEIGDNHLYTALYGVSGELYGQTHADALTHGVITMPATHQVVYNDKIDLKPFIETHADYITFARYGKSKHDKSLTAAELSALGLKYKFTLVDYRVGQEITSESAHMEQISDGVFAPRSVDASGKTKLGQVATREVIDREPLVRVDLVDDQNNVVLYGYIKIRIVASKVEDKKVEVNLSDIYMNCGDEGKMTWSQVENLILSQLGTNGLTKQEFERNYYLEVDNGSLVMPTQTTGPLYTAGWQAVRYTAADVTKKILDSNAKTYGRVWYTPHDNATNPHAWDAQTNVLVWNISKNSPASNMTDAKILAFEKDYGVTYQSKGLNTKDVYTWVRFINKVDGTSVWVKLNFAPGKVHFAYGKVAGKDLHHWFKLNSAYVPGTESDLDVHANVPSPAEVGQIDLTNDKFTKDVREYWINKKLLLTLESEKAKFSQFYTAAGAVKTTVDFEFTLPEKGVNSTVNAAADGTWVVSGASGSKWTLKLGDNNHTIYAVKQDGVALATPEKVATLSQNTDDHTFSILHYFGDEDNNKNAATDLLNKMGYYDNKGEDIHTKDYLTDNIDRTFTAYVKVTASKDPCYAPLLGNNLFNVRFMRPINVWPKNIEWTDALNSVETVKLQDLVTIKDWRTMDVLVNGTYAHGQVPYSFYGISSLSVIREQIHTDAPLAEAIRKGAALTDPAQIVALPSVENVPSLTSYTTSSGITTANYLKLFNGYNTEVFNSAAHGLSGFGWSVGNVVTKNFGKITYTNNGGGAQIFHIYVPIAVKYKWGNVINEKTNASTSGVKKDLNYTQVVWATITVNKTTGSAKRN